MVKSRPIVIAHRGAPGYLPEHTLPSKALAYAMGADFLEQDVVATRDDELVVLHDIYLDRVSDVAERFPQRARPDGRYYVRDFDLAELRNLKVSERRQADGSAVYAGRFPPNTGNFHIHTFAEELEFLETLNKATGGTVGCYPEIKRPAWHREEGVDIAPLFLRTLKDYAYEEKEHAVFVQCFDADELIRIRHELGCRMALVQLIGENDWGEGPTETLATGETFTFWEFNLRFKTDSSKDGPPKGKPGIVRAGMQGDRAFVVFAGPAEISTFIKKQC